MGRSFCRLPTTLGLASQLAGCFLYPTLPTGGSDAGAEGGSTALNHCEEANFIDRAAPGDDRTVAFGGEQGSGSFAYQPPCISVAPGQSVHFAGEFHVHPMSPGISRRMTTAGSPGNPIPRTVMGTALE